MLFFFGNIRNEVLVFVGALERWWYFDNPRKLNQNSLKTKRGSLARLMNGLGFLFDFFNPLTPNSVPHLKEGTWVTFSIPLGNFLFPSLRLGANPGNTRQSHDFFESDKLRYF